ncbi:MAG: ferritin family protein [Deltaproteobacteria bacterium]|nr:ferritin family protein [Deltaproteobacteria bacterium]
MHSFDEIIEFAIQLEQESVEFYDKLSQKSQKPELKKIFLEMKEEELRHKSTLEGILIKHQLPDGKKLYPDPDLKIADYVVDVDENKENLNFQDIMIIAMKREKATLTLYQDFYDNTNDPDLKIIFDFLVSEEAKHKHYFEAEFDDQL